MFKVATLGLAASGLIGVLAAVSGYTFVTADGASYLSNNPEACVNCHIMRPQFDDWRHGSHHAVATCNDCHLPHDKVWNTFFVEASNGYHHSKAFTLMDFAEPIRIKPGNAQVLEANCIRCHGELAGELLSHGTLGAPTDPEQKADLYGCVRCHLAVGHASAQ